MHISTYQEAAAHTGQTRVPFLDTIDRTESRESTGSPSFFSLIEKFRAVLEVDSSSVLPQFELRSETLLTSESPLEAGIPEDVLEYDIFVKMPPIKEYSVTAKIVSREKARPMRVDPDWIEF